MEIFEFFPDDLKEGKVTAWLHGVTTDGGDKVKRSAIVICPGGGYFMVLGYPVILVDEFAHQDSIKAVSGSEVDTEDYKWFGLNTHVDEQTPPAFLLHTAEDNAVPVENSLKMAMAMSANKVPFELHVFPTEPHGMSVCTNDVYSKSDYNHRWVQWSIAWLNRVLDYSK